MDLWSKLIELLRVAPQYFLAFVIASAAFVFLPAQYAQAMGLSEFQAAYRAYGAIILIASTSIVLAYGLGEVRGWIGQTVRSHKEAKQRTNGLHALTPGEGNLLKKYIQADTRSLWLDGYDGDVLALVQADVLYRPAPESGARGAFNIREWARQYLREHPEAIGLRKEGDKFVRAK